MSEIENAEVAAEEAVEVAAEEPRIFGPNTGVCRCGHVSEAHGAGWKALGGAERAEASGIGESECVVISAGSPSGWLCGCTEFREIAKVSSAFAFKRGEYADGNNHTLVQGMFALMKAGGVFMWSEHGGPDCEGLKMESGRSCVASVDGEPVPAMPPYPYREDGKWGAGIGETRIVCRECYLARLAK